MKKRNLLIVIQCLLALYIFPFNGRSQGIEISPGANITFTGSASVKIYNGGLVNNGSFTKGSETIEFFGTIASVISGSSTINMHNLSLANTGGITTQLALFNINDLTIVPESKFTIDPGKAVAIGNTLTNNAGISGLVLKSSSVGSGSLLCNSTGVNATVERFMNGNSWAWHFLSSPVSSQSISGSFTPSGAGNDYDFYTWYEPQMVWVNYKNITVYPTWNTANGNTNFVPGRGYLVAYETNNSKKTFSGVLNSGQVTYALTQGGGSTYQYYNLIGNPYPCSVDWKAPTGWNMTNLSGTDKSYWVWNDASGNYGAYTTDISGDIGTNGVTRYISSGQGFFVLASSAGSFTMDNGIKVNNAQAYLKNSEGLNEELKLKLSCSANTYSDEAIVAFSNSDPLAGSEKFSSMYTQAPELWTKKNGLNYSINFMGDLTTEKVIPVTIKAGVAGNYTLTASQQESFGNNQVIRLEDRVARTFVNLTVDPSITFNVSQPTTITDRFYLHFKKSELGNTAQAVIPDFRVFLFNGKVTVHSLQQQSGKVTVTDMAGRNIANSRVEAGATIHIDISGHSGVYIVSVLSNKGISNTKVIVK